MTSLTYSPDFTAFAHNVNGTTLYNVLFLKKRSRILLPSEEGWTTKRFEDRLKTREQCEQALKRGLNMGYPPRENEFVIDIDRKNGGIESYSRLCEDMGHGERLRQSVQTATGGAHCYYRHSEKDLRLAGNLTRYGYPGIDVIYSGRYVVIPGCIVTDNQKEGGYAWQDDSREHWSNAVKWVLDAVRRRESVKTAQAWVGDLDDLAPGVEMGLKGGDLSLQDLRSMLTMLDPDLDYESWLRVLMGVHTTFEGNNQARDVVIDWSAGGKKFKGGEIEKKWESFDFEYLFGSNGSSEKKEVITIGTVIWMVREEAKIQEADRATELKTKISKAELKDTRARVRVEEEIRCWNGEERYREGFVQAFAARLKELKIAETLKGVRELLKMDEKIQKNRLKRLEDFFRRRVDGWVLRASSDKFLFIKNRRDTFELSSRAFDCNFASIMGDRGAASRYFTGNNPTGHIYVPTVKMEQYSITQPALFETSGEMVLNLCPVEEIVKRSKSYAPESVKIMDKFVMTQKVIWGEEADILLDFICCQYQRPELKLSWAMVLTGPMGLGKSLLTEMFQTTFGFSNVGAPQPKQIQKDFDSIFLPKKLIVFDEFEVPPHKMTETMTKLRAAITSPRLTLELKGKDVHEYLNPSNFMFFSNRLTPLLISMEDRRICPLQAQWSNLFDLCSHLGTASMRHWYDDFYELIRSRPGDVVRYWEDLEMSPGAETYLLKGAHAPLTRSKADMVQDSIDSIKGLQEIREIIETKTGFDPMITKEWVCVQTIFDDFADEYFSSPAVQRELLAHVGYSHRVRFDTSVRGNKDRQTPCYYLYVSQGGQKTRFSFFCRSETTERMQLEIRAALRTYQSSLAKEQNFDDLDL